MNLEGKRALVTGGARRIGRAIVRALQARGAEVTVHYFSSEKEAKKLSPRTVRAELGDPEALRRMMDSVGPLDVLINNASIFSKDALPEATPERVRREFEINLFAPMELLRRFAARGRAGAAINLLDQRVTGLDATCVPYLLTKKGLETLTRLAALEWAPRIRVNAVAPGPILPPTGTASEPAGRIPLGRRPTPEEVAEAVVFLLEADSITGQTIFIDGGRHLPGSQTGREKEA